MSSSNLLQQLWELDSSSSEFHAQLAHTLLVEDSMSQVQDLPSEELKRLVEGLDSVCIQIASVHSTLNDIIGSRSPQPRD